jgi:hypothetical protein
LIAKLLKLRVRYGWAIAVVGGEGKKDGEWKIR